MSLEDRVRPLVELLYPGRGEQVTAQVLALLDRHRPALAGRAAHPALSERTAYLITYGDTVRRPGEPPLRTLAGLLRDHVGDAVSDVHLLPIFPWTSDDGFAVVDHRQVDPALGTWDDVTALTPEHGVLLDFVANHVSASSPWFSDWLADVPERAGFFLDRDPAFDTSRVVRPRTLPLFSEHVRPDGRPVEVWTTFGPDQVDVDVSTPAALLELTDVLLGYLARGASAVRLDAIGFLWKESGTTCLHLPQTHAVVQLWRALVDAAAPGALLLTETNVPHEENVSYFGDGTDEAHLVYQFALPPLVLHSFVSGSTARLSTWAAGTGPVSPTATFFTFLASHDGIGLRATEGVLTDDERQALVDRTLAHGGRVSMAASADGGERVYELNLTYLDALATPAEAADPAVVAAKALAAHSILLTVVGVPAVYVHSLLGSGPDHDGLRDSGIPRRINRGVLDADELLEQLHTDPRRSAVFTGLVGLLRARQSQPALSPFSPQAVEVHDERVFVVRRGTGDDVLVCATNVTGDEVELPAVRGTDVLTGAVHRPLRLGPWGRAWVRPD